MITDNDSKDYSKELTCLYETICEELKEYHLTYPELEEIYKNFINLILISGQFKKSIKTVENILHGTFNFTSEEIDEFIKECKMATLNVSIYSNKFSFYYLSKKDHLKAITSKYLSHFDYPYVDLKQINVLIKSISKVERYRSFIAERVKRYVDTTIKWYLHPLKGEDIYIEDAAYIWPESQGVFRFISKDGHWGFVVDKSFQVVNLPDSIIQMEDFKCLRARVLISDNKQKVSIDYKNTILEDFNESQLYWGFIDLRGNVISKRKYIRATDYNNNISTVSENGMSWDFMEIKDGLKNPHYDFKIDLFDDITEESAMERERLFEQRQNNKRQIKFNNQVYDGGESEDDIMKALRNRNGDIYGF